jgi:hypothetical protein
MLTLLDINRALDRLGAEAFIPRTRRRRLVPPRHAAGRDVKHGRQTTKDVGTTVVIPLAALCGAVLVLGVGHPAGAAGPEECRRFDEECADARAAGYRDVGICNVERLECPSDRDAGGNEPSREAGGDERHGRHSGLRR